MPSLPSPRESGKNILMLHCVDFTWAAASIRAVSFLRPMMPTLRDGSIVLFLPLRGIGCSFGEIPNAQVRVFPCSKALIAHPCPKKAPYHLHKIFRTQLKIETSASKGAQRHGGAVRSGTKFIRQGIGWQAKYRGVAADQCGTRWGDADGTLLLHDREDGSGSLRPHPGASATQGGNLHLVQYASCQWQMRGGREKSARKLERKGSGNQEKGEEGGGRSRDSMFERALIHLVVSCLHPQAVAAGVI